MNTTLQAEALAEAIQLIGSQSAMARACGKAQGHVSHWIKAGRVPAEYCPLIERATDGKVRCEQLRPDVDWAYLRSAPPAETPEENTAAEVTHG